MIYYCLQEVEMLLEENDGLQRKLLSQEDDFRLQNETLMKELGQVGGEELRLGVHVNLPYLMSIDHERVYVNYMCRLLPYHDNIMLHGRDIVL